MHGIVDLEPPVYSSVDAGSFAPFHQHGLTCLHSLPSPSTWARGLVRRPLTRAHSPLFPSTWTSPSLSSWACLRPSPSTWACRRPLHRRGLLRRELRIIRALIIHGLGSLGPIALHHSLSDLSDPIALSAFSSFAMEAVVPSEAIVPFTYPKAFMPLTCPKAVVPLTCPKVDKAVDLSEGRRAANLSEGRRPVRRPSCR